MEVVSGSKNVISATEIAGAGNRRLQLATVPSTYAVYIYMYCMHYYVSVCVMCILISYTCMYVYTRDTWPKVFKEGLFWAIWSSRDSRPLGLTFGAAGPVRLVPLGGLVPTALSAVEC